MTDNPNPATRKFLIEHQPNPERSADCVPVVPPGVERSLRAFLEAASLARNEWHTMPGYKLALRIVACNEPENTIAFDLCESPHTFTARRFRYDARSQTISTPPTEPVEHLELVAHRELPDDPDELARVIATLVRDTPAFLQLLETGAPAGHSHKASTPILTLDTRRPGPVNHAVSDILRHLTSHWFGGRHVDWRFPRRFLCAFFGSAFVFTAQSFVYSARFPIFFSSELRPFQARATDSELLAELPVQIVILAVFSVSFAGITAVVDHQHGPVRLFLGGFLLPYLVIALLTWLNAGG